jgi:hypothetical protein
MDDINQILKGISTAASNPLAFVSYIVALIAWVLIRIRVGRNKNLLERLKDLPKADRLEALKAEMGVLPIREGLSPEQWIRSRINRYYFLGFVVLCAVFVILFAISAYAAIFKEKLAPNSVSDAIKTEVVISDQRLMRAVAEVDLGVGNDFVISRLGPPRHTLQWNKTTTCSDYDFPFAKVGFIYDLNKVVFITIIAKRGDFHPDVIGRYGSDTQGCLGCFTFGEANDSEDFLEEEQRYPLAIGLHFGGNARTDIYVEEHRVHSSWNRRVFLLSTPEGYVPKSDNDPFLDLVHSIEDWQMSDKPLKSVSPEERDRFIKARRGLRPNGFALLYEDEVWIGPSQVSASDPSIKQSRWPDALVGTTTESLVGTVPKPIYYPSNCSELILSGR